MELELILVLPQTTESEMQLHLKMKIPTVSGATFVGFAFALTFSIKQTLAKQCRKANQTETELGLKVDL